MSLSNNLELQFLNKLLGRTDMTLNTDPLYIGLSTSTPLDDGTNFTEPVGGAYARVSYANNVTNWPNATTISGVGTKTNGTAISFLASTGSWGTITHWGLFTASSGGTPILTGPLSAPVVVAINNLLIFGIGALTVTMD